MKAKASIIKQEAEIEASQKEVQAFFKAIVPNFVLELGGVLTDTVKYWRFRNQVAIVKKSNQLIDDSGLPKKQVPLKVLLPIMENSSLEEDEAIQQKWASLLANAATGKVDITPNYSEILKELSSFEVLLLDSLYDEAMRETDEIKRKELQFGKENVARRFKIPVGKVELAIENLYRLGLLRSPGSKGASIGNYPFAIRTTDFFELTATGLHFVSACRWS